MPPKIDATVDLEASTWMHLIGDAFLTLGRTENRIIRVKGQSPHDRKVVIQLVINERPLHTAMVDFAWRILGLSIVISLITATLVYLSLQWMLVRPMHRITANMTAFREDPEDASRVMVPSGRRDEIGVAERELAGMQKGLREALRQSSHLAALGTAVAKINHDLRGILSSALVVSDRLEDSEDPEVRRITPTIVSAIERAVALCSQTLGYVGKDQSPFNPSRFALRTLVDDIAGGLVVPINPEVAIANRVPEAFEVEADRDQLYRVLDNLARNAAEAGARTITISATANGAWDEIDVADDGPGLPPKAQQNLFKPFDGSARAGGTGLGLAIAGELLRNHGGVLKLVETGAAGTRFRVSLPRD
jgi:signal transduction histidine kinase